MFDHKPFFVAEISANHLGSLSRAHQLIDAAANSGANAVKFQTYKATTMTLDLESFRVDANHLLWGNKSLFELYKEAHTPWEWHEELFSHCRERGVVPFSSPFDNSAVDLLESLNCPLYKIASLETGDLALIERVAQTGKPIIVSTGATTLSEIEELIDVIRNTSDSHIVLLLCTSAYPSVAFDARLRRMDFLRKTFGVEVGISDHTLGIGVAIASIALGSVLVEKHLTLSRQDGGLDSKFSLEPNEFAALVQHGRDAFLSLGDGSWKDISSEDNSRSLRRSLYVSRDVIAGEVATLDNVKSIRPSGGLPPKYLKQILGKKFTRAVSMGEPTSFELFKT